MCSQRVKEQKFKAKNIEGGAIWPPSSGPLGLISQLYDKF